MTVGERIKSVREYKKITQGELAKAVGTTKQTIYKYENNIVTNIPSTRIEAIATHLGVSEAYLMGWKGRQMTFANQIFADELLEICQFLDFEKMQKVISYAKKLSDIQSAENEIIEESIHKARMEELRNENI